MTDSAAEEFYSDVMRLLDASGPPFLVGGTYAFREYTGVQRPTKDFDIHVKPEDYPKAADAARRGGFSAEQPFPHWLGKIRRGKYFIDVVYSSGNGLSPVDDEWFENANDREILGRKARLAPPEEMLWTKAFIMERERYDGADVVHLMHSTPLDWNRLLRRFGENYRVLYSHIVMFGFVYPDRRDNVPSWVMNELHDRMSKESHPGPRTCYGTLVSRQQYLYDVARGYLDPRVQNISSEDLNVWTEGIRIDGDK